MSGSRVIAPLVLLASAPFLLGACGGDDSSSADEEEITAAIEQSATTDTAANCSELQTQNFTEQTEFESGEAAIKSCEDSAGDGDVAGDSVEVSNIAVEGDTATAEVAFTGGGLGGQELALSLVKEGEQWKLDSLDEFLLFDKDRFAQGIAEGASSDGETPQFLVKCIALQVRVTADDELKAIYLSGDEEQLVRLFGPCFQGT
jgi:hypothetical protein